MADHVSPFLPVGATSKIDANTTAANGVALAGDGPITPATWREYRIFNPTSNETIFYAYGSSNTNAANNAVVPTNASVGGNCYPLPPGAVEVVRAPQGQYWTGVLVTTNASFYVTPGRGI